MMNSIKRAVLLAMCVLLIPAAVAGQTLLRLSPGDDLAAAVQGAGPGATIELAAGNYDALVLRGVSGASGAPITVRSENPADPARLSGLNLREVSHLVLDGLVFDYIYTIEDTLSLRPFQVFTTRDLVIENSVFDGDFADDDLAGEGVYPTGFGLAVRSSAQVRLQNNEVRDFYRGLIFNDVVDLSVLHNDVHSIRMDGMNFAQVDRVLIEGNTIRDFKRAIESVDHADMIQFWTSNTKRPSANITIRNNVLNSGLGWYTQSIFMRNELVDRGRAGKEMFYKNVRIEGNVIINAQAHGITVGETDGLAIVNNTLVHNARSDPKREHEKLRIPQVRVSTLSTDVLIRNNAVAFIVGYDDQADWAVGNNLFIQDSSDKQLNHYNALFFAAQSGDPRDLESFQYLSDGALAGSGIGAPMLEVGAKRPAPKMKSDDLVPIIRTVPDPILLNRFSFDITQGALLLGLDLTGAQIEWIFGDGTKGLGPTVSHDFARPGRFDTKLIITLPDGKVLEGAAQITSKRPEVVVFNKAQGTITSYANDVAQDLDLSLNPGPITLGGDRSLVRIPREAIAPFFGSRSFVLQTRVRSMGGYKAAGTLLHIAKTLVVTIGGRGTLEVEFNTETAATVKLRSPPLPVLQGEWIDVGIDYSDADRMLKLSINGSLVAAAPTEGQIRPLEHWGLVLGHPFQPQKTFQGEMDALVLTVGGNAGATRN